MLEQKDRKRKKWTIGFNFAIIAAYSLISILPSIFIFISSFMGYDEVNRTYSMIYGSGIGEHYAALRLLPERFTLNQYYMALLRNQDFLFRFWNSMILIVPIVIGVLIISTFGGYAFAKFDFPYRERLFLLYIIVMLLPYQVTLVPNFMVLNTLNLVGNRWAIILPAIFSPFGVFLMRQFMRNISDEILDSARLEGAGEGRIFRSVVVPMSLPGVASLFILTVIDSWSMVEQPLVLLKDPSKYPLSIILTYINQEQIGIAFVGGVVFMIPVILIFLVGKQYLLEGISKSVVK